jgi:hypothetical protein
MTATQFKKFINNLTQNEQRSLVIKVETNSLQNGLNKSRQLMEKMQREMRIQKLELAVSQAQAVWQQCFPVATWELVTTNRQIIN